MDLLTRFKEGDIDAFETLFRQFQSEMYGWIVQIVRDRGVAEDLTIEAFWRIYEARARFKNEGAFGAWARRIAVNLAIDHIRRRRPEQELSEEFAAVDPPDSALRRETREQIARAFRRLPPKLQVAATLALIEERSYQEIAEVLGMPVGSVRARVFRAVQRLRKQLEQMGVTP